MAVTFGRLGTTTINRGSTLTVTSEFKQSAGGGSTWTLSFTGLDCYSIGCTSNTQTIPENVTLYFSITTNGTVPNWSMYKNDNAFFNSPGGDGITNTTESFIANDTLYISLASIGLAEGTLTIRQDNASGRIIATAPYGVTD